MTTPNNIQDELRERYELIKEIMQSGFEVAMGGTPFEDYDQEEAFEEAVRVADQKLLKLLTEHSRKQVDNELDNELDRLRYTVIATVEEMGGHDYPSAINAYIRLRKVEQASLNKGDK